MTTNKYFTQFSYGREQDLIEDLIIESIKQKGVSFYYLPRNAVSKDHIWGEDSLSMFTNAIPVEMYIKDVDGFQGDGHFLSKFNLEIRDSIVLTIARKRWSQIRTEKLLGEVGYNIQLESANTNSPANSASIMLETGTTGVNNYSITSNRPLEGDLVYFPVTNKIFEIKFVEHEQVFYQTGALQTYDLRCEVFEYSSERLDTGVASIDSIEDVFTLDVLTNEFLLEDGNKLIVEGGTESILLEYNLDIIDSGANNNLYQEQAGNIIDFSERNPFTASDRW